MSAFNFTPLSLLLCLGACGPEPIIDQEHDTDLMDSDEPADPRDPDPAQGIDFPKGLASRDARVDSYAGDTLQEIDSFYLTFQPDLVVHSTAENQGYVTDRDGNEVSASASQPIDYPHVAAIELANTDGHGGNIFLSAGSYGWFRIMTQYSSHDQTVDRLTSSEESPVRVVGEVGNLGEILVNFSSPGPGGYTLQMRETSSNGSMEIDNLEFYRLRFECGRDCIHIGTFEESEDGTDVVYDNLLFADVELDGGYDWISQTGNTGKWGFHTRNLGNFSLIRSLIHDTNYEHGVYVHAPRGRFEAIANTIHTVGRTAFQFTARKDPNLDGELHPANEDAIHLYNNHMADTGIADGCSGGSTVSVFGRNKDVYMKNNLIELGFDTYTDGLRDAMDEFCLYTPFTGAFTSAAFENDGYENSRGPFVIEHNTVRFATGAGDRAVVTLAAVDTAIFRYNQVQTGSDPSALQIGSKDAAHKATPQAYCVRDNDWVAGETGKTMMTISDIVVDEWDEHARGDIDCARE